MVPARGIHVSRISKVIRFGAVGIVATVTDFTLFNLGLLLLAQPGHGMVIGINTIAFAAATVVSYQLNSRFTFTAVRDSGSLARYLLVALGGAAVYNGALLFALQFIAVEHTLLVNAAKVAAVVLSATWNFIGFGTFALVDRRPPEEARSAP